MNFCTFCTGYSQVCLLGDPRITYIDNLSVHLLLYSFYKDHLQIRRPSIGFLYTASPTNCTWVSDIPEYRSHDKGMVGGSISAINILPLRPFEKYRSSEHRFTPAHLISMQNNRTNYVLMFV